MFKLVIQDDEGKTTVVPLIRDEITIGRKEGNTIRLTERNVSRRHARILRNNGEVQIEDLGSYNGIRVNNARIAERVSLRVSDQVQIGDYKLYLKAEGVEQVDGAPASDADRARGTTTAPRRPSRCRRSPRRLRPRRFPSRRRPDSVGSGLVPDRNRASGRRRLRLYLPPYRPRPHRWSATRRARWSRRDNSGARELLGGGASIADPALVAKLTETAPMAGSMVISSNFAGKEFELSRPQMIIGRTDDNDIVVNHRSISRNHAKMVREPETNRYTVSDLQSSNGVRVNGTDYGKVELRRGDVVDLGHVRLRFIEPGEVFVFSRDAEICDVAEPGSKGGLLVAVVLGVVVLGAIAVYFATRTPDAPTDPGGGPGVVEHPLGSQNTSNPPAADARNDVAAIDAAETMVAATPDSGTTTTTPNGGTTGRGSNTVANNGNPDEAAFGETNKKCADLQLKADWDGLKRCAAELATLNKAKAQAYDERANMELKSAKALEEGQQQLRTGDSEGAMARLKAVPGKFIDGPESGLHRREGASPRWDQAKHRQRGREEQLHAREHDQAASGALDVSARSVRSPASR